MGLDMRFLGRKWQKKMRERQTELGRQREEARRQQQITDKVSANFEKTEIKSGEQIEEEQNSCRWHGSVLMRPTRYGKRQQSESADTPHGNSSIGDVGLRLKATPVATSSPAARVTKVFVVIACSNSANHRPNRAGASGCIFHLNFESS